MSGRRSKLALLVSFIVVACGGGADEASTTTTLATSSTTGAAEVTITAPTTTVTTQMTTTTSGSVATTAAQNPDGADGSGCAPGSESSLPDGRWFGHVITSTADTIEFDLACWFSGQAAIDAAAEDGEESPPPNDYYVRNQSDLTRSIPISPDTVVTFFPTGDPTGETSGTFAEWRDMVAERGPYFGVWLDVAGGEVVDMMEQWVP